MYLDFKFIMTRKQRIGLKEKANYNISIDCYYWDCYGQTIKRTQLIKDTRTCQVAKELTWMMKQGPYIQM